MAEITAKHYELGIDAEKLKALMNEIKKKHSLVFKGQNHRPRSIEYFDRACVEAYEYRVGELLEHKKQGGKIVGTFCTFIPEELIIATGATPIRLDAGTQLPISDAETILPREICPMIKSFVGLKLGKSSPYFELVDFLVGETTCDAKKKVWEILQHYLPVYILELPQKKALMSREHWAREVYNFKEMMEIETRRKITSNTLREATETVSLKRKALQRLAKLRRNIPTPISGKDASLVYQVGFYDDIRRFTMKVEELCDELEERVKKNEGIASPQTPRIIITGCPMAMPDWKIHDLIETSGAVIVGEDTCSGLRYHMDPLINWRADSLVKQIKAIADRYLNIPCPCFTPGYCAVLQVTQMAKAHKVDGVIYYVLQFCHGFNVEYHKIEKFLNEAGIPVIKIQTDYSEEDIEQLRTRIEAFLERIKE